jgi:hypothetical protein
LHADGVERVPYFSTRHRHAHYLGKDVYEGQPTLYVEDVPLSHAVIEVNFIAITTQSPRRGWRKKGAA